MIHSDAAIWTAAGVSVKPTARPGQASAGDVFDRFTVSLQPRTAGELTPELARSLRDWLTYQLGETPACPQPDEIRLAVDEQRAALRARSSDAVSEHFRSGLAWGEHALRAVADAAEGRRSG